MKKNFSRGMKKKRKKNGVPEYNKERSGTLHSENAAFMNSSYGLETAPNEIKTFLQHLHNYAVSCDALSFLWRPKRRIKKKFPWRKKKKKNGGFDRMMKVSSAKKKALK